MCRNCGAVEELAQEIEKEYLVIWEENPEEYGVLEAK